MTTQHPRPTGAGMLTPTYIAALAASLVAGGATFVGILPMAIFSGLLNVVVALGAAVVVVIGLATAWHGVLRYAAFAHTGGEKGLAACMGTGLFSIGCSTSAWFLATILAGLIALHGYQRTYVENLTTWLEQANANVALYDGLITTLRQAAANLNAMGNCEKTDGCNSKQRGNGPVSKAYIRAAISLLAASADLEKSQMARHYEQLGVARENIAGARRAIAANDAAGFEEHAAAALTAINSADAAVPRFDGLEAGLDVSAAKDAPQAIRALAGAGDEIARKRRVLKLVSYEPIDARMAIIVNPQPLGWITAVAIEALPLILLFVLLALWRDSQPQLPIALQAHESDQRRPSTLPSPPAE